MKQPVLLDWIVLLVLGTVWGASFLFIKRAVVIYTPMQMAMWRMVLATLIYLPFAAAYWSRIDWKRWKPLAVVAFCGSAIPNFFFAVAQQHVSSSLAGVLNSMTPLFTLILGTAFFDMRFTRNKVIGILLGLVGAAILIFMNKGGGDSKVVFALLCVLATVCYAINANVVATYLKDQPPAGIASAAFVITGGLFIVGLAFSGGWEVAWKSEQGMIGLGYITYLAAIGTVVGSIAYFWLLQRTNAIFATSVTYLLPISAIIIGAWDGEAIGMTDYIGTAVIMTGLYLSRK